MAGLLDNSMAAMKVDKLVNDLVLRRAARKAEQ
jgi:hypothetical protein